MLNKIVSAILGSKHERDIKKLLPVVAHINTLEPDYLEFSTEDFQKKTQSFKTRLEEGESLDDILPEAFALVREAARRTLGERPYDVQILGGIVLHQGKITEMKTGEGKTLCSVSAAYLNSLAGKGVHMVTVNDYLAERDAKWMEPVFNLLGVSVGYVVSNMDTESRKAAYAADITYATNNELGFDYLRDNMRWDMKDKTQRGHAYCIVDEIDSILIDESRTPLIISGVVDDDTSKYAQVNGLVNLFEECAKDPETDDYPEEPVGDYKMDEKSKRIMFTDQGMNKIEEVLLNRKIISGSLFAENNFEYLLLPKLFELIKCSKTMLITWFRMERLKLWMSLQDESSMVADIQKVSTRRLKQKKISKWPNRTKPWPLLLFKTFFVSTANFLE